MLAWPVCVRARSPFAAFPACALALCDPCTRTPIPRAIAKTSYEASSVVLPTLFINDYTVTSLLTRMTSLSDGLNDEIDRNPVLLIRIQYSAEVEVLGKRTL